MKEASLKDSLSRSEDGNTDLEELTNKELLDVVGSAFDSAVEARTKLAIEQASKGSKALEDKLDKLEKYLLRKEASEGIQKARNRFRDFDDYREDISNIFNKYPGITPEDAYILAKGNKASTSPAQKDLETEKPISLATRAEEAEKRHIERIAKRKDEGTGTMNRREFRSFIQEAAERVIKSRE